MNRNPQVGDLAYAIVFGQRSIDAVRGVVGAVEKDCLLLHGPCTTVRCKREGAVVIPPSDYTEEECDLVDTMSRP